MTLRLVGLLALVLVLGLAGPARAQSNGEPAPEDLTELIAAVTSTLAEPVYAFDLSLEAHIGVEGEPPLNVQLSGAGALDLLSGSPAFALDLRGQSTDASGENALNLAARIVNDAIYFAETGDSANPADWTGARFADFRGLIEAQFASDNVQMGDALTQLQALAGLLPASGVQFSDLLALTREPDELIAGAPIGHLALNIDLARFARQDSFKALIENFSVTFLGESLGSNGRVIAALMAAFFEDTSARLDALIDPGAGLLWGARFTLDSDLDPVLLGQTGAPVSISVRVEVNFRDFGLPQTITVPEGITLLTADQMVLALGFGPDSPAVPTPEVALPTPTLALPTPAGTRQVAVLVTPNATPRPRFTLTPTTPPTATPTPPPSSTPTATVAPAQPLPPDTPVQFVLAPGAVADFVYTGARGDVVTFSARSLDPATGLDPVLELLDSGGVRLGFNDDLVGARPGFTTLDSVLANVKLPADGAYTLRINSFDPGDTGPVEVLASTLGGAAQVPTAQAASATYPIVSVSQSHVPANGEDCTTVDLLAGETLTATVRTLDTALDSRLTLRDPAGRDLAFNDDHGSSDPNLGRFDSRIAGVVVAVDGLHQLCVSGFAGSAGAYALTVTRDHPGAAPGPTLAPTAATTPAGSGEVQVINDVVRPNELYFTTIQAEAGDVYTLTARALDPALDPQVGIFFEDDNEPLFVNDDHSSSSPDLAFYDARLTNIILPETGRYDVAVAGYQDSAGPFELTIERSARGGPLGEPVVQSIPGKLETNGVYVYEANLPAGAYVTITVAAVDENFDPQVTLITPDGVIAIDNDDNSSGDATLRASDSRIHNYLVEQGGFYTIEIRGYQGVGGFFTLTIATLQ